MACTAYPPPAPGLFINVDQGVWKQANEAKGGKSATYNAGALTVSGPNGSITLSAVGGQAIRHKFFGAGSFLAVCFSDTGVGPKSHRVSIVDFTATAIKVVALFTTPSDNNPPLPFVQYDSGPGSACCAGGASAGQFYGLGIYRSDTGAPLCLYSGSGYTPTVQVIGEATAGGVRVKDGGTVIAGPCPLPSGNLVVQPPSQTFGDVKVGGCPQAPSTRTFTLRNTGDDCLVVQAIANGGPYSVTSVSSPLPATLAKNETLTVTVRFAPGGVGTFNNVPLVVTRAPARGDDRLLCSGKAVAAQPSVAVTPATVSFGRLPVGAMSGPQQVTITNNGDVPVGITVAPVPNSPFAWPSFSNTLGCGTSATIPVTFTAQVEGPAADALTVVATPGGTKTVALTGVGCVPRAKILVPPAPFPAFGDVRQGYRMPRFITIRNTGDAALTFAASISGPDAALFGLMKPPGSITDVAASLTYSVDPPSRCGAGSVGDGAQELAVVVFANAAPPRTLSATLTISAHNDASAPATFALPLSANLVAANTVDAVAVFDTSGSMAQAVQGGGNKMQAAIQAGKLFVNLIPADLGNRVAATRFSTDATTFLPIADVTGAGQQAQVDAITNPPLAPNGMTAIAAGAMTGLKEFLVPHAGGVTPPNLTKAMVVLTDGMDNTAYLNPDDGKFYSILGIPAFDPGNLLNTVATSPLPPAAGVKVFAVGLGTSQDLDKNQLATLSSGAGGYWQAVDPTQPAVAYELMKFYTQIYMDMVDVQAIRDPRDIINPGQKHVHEFDVLRGDVSAMVVVYDLGGLRLPFWLESPTGEIVDAAFVPSGFQLRSGWTETTRFLDFQLPWTDPARYAGRWKLIVLHDGRVCRGDPDPRERRELGFLPGKCRKSRTPVQYGFAIGVGSNFRLQAYLTPGAVRVGEPIRLTGVPTEAGLPALGCTVTVDAESPTGQAWTGIVLADDGAHEDGDPNDGEYARPFAQTSAPGTYTFTFRATGFTRDGEPVTREAVRSKYVEGRREVPGDGGDTRDGDCCEKVLRRLDEQNRALGELVRIAARVGG